MGFGRWSVQDLGGRLAEEDHYRSCEHDYANDEFNHTLSPPFSGVLNSTALAALGNKHERIINYASLKFKRRSFFLQSCKVYVRQLYFAREV